MSGDGRDDDDRAEVSVVVILDPAAHAAEQARIEAWTSAGEVMGDAAVAVLRPAIGLVRWLARIPWGLILWILATGLCLLLAAVTDAEEPARVSPPQALSWELPTRAEYCVDSGAALDSVAGTRIYRLLADVPAPTTTWTPTDLPAGDHDLVVAAYDDRGAEAGISRRVRLTVAGDPPPPPAMDLTVAEGAWLYALAQSRDRLTLYPVARATASADCDPEVVVMGRHRVDVRVARWLGSQRPPVVVADCTTD